MIPEATIAHAIAFAIEEGIIPTDQLETVFEGLKGAVLEMEERGYDTTEYEVYGFEVVDTLVAGGAINVLIGPPFTSGAGPLRSMFPADTTVFDPINLDEGPEFDPATNPYTELFTVEGDTPYE